MPRTPRPAREIRQVIQLRFEDGEWRTSLNGRDYAGPTPGLLIDKLPVTVGGPETFYLSWPLEEVPEVD